MIAASEPQEFIPSGRQQVACHPGLPKTKQDLCSEHANLEVDSFVLHRLEKVSLTESDSLNSDNTAEWWIVRQSTDYFCQKNDNRNFKKDTDNVDETSSNDLNVNINKESPWNSKAYENISDLYSSKNLNKSRFSNENEFLKNVSKSNVLNKSLGNQVNFRMNELKCSSIQAMEEELYVKGRTAVWSKGIISTAPNNYTGMSRITLCSYTMDNKIKHALWCTFHLERPSFNKIANEIINKPDIPLGKPLPCICLIDSCNMRVFTKNNEDFLNCLPFQVSGMWSTKYGILLEKESSNSAKAMNQSTINITDSQVLSSRLFSLTHPLDELCPVVVKHNGMSYMNNSSLKIIFTCSDPSIVFVYDNSSGLHYIFLLRRIKNEEFMHMSTSKSKLFNTLPSLVSISNKVKQNLSIWSGHGAGLPLATGSPYTSRAASISSLVSPYNSRSHNSMAAISRCQSPCLSPFVGSGGWVNRSSYIHHEDTNTTAGLTQLDITVHPKPAMPDLCLDHIWTENSLSVKGSFSIMSGAASKAFLSTDLVGQNYFCYLVPIRGQLIIVRMDLSNDNILLFGASYTINAKDAVSIQKLHMILVLESNGNLTLYSGPVLVGKIHVGGVSAEFSSSPFRMRSQPVHFKSPFPRRSSLLPHCGTPMAVPKFDEHLISPVYPAMPAKDKINKVLHSSLLNEPYITNDSSGNITSLLDAVSDRVTLQYSDNSFYRITLPALATSNLVENCLNALRQYLQKDIAMTLISKWYAIRNAPGPSDLAIEQEWQIFTSLLFGLLGYDVEKLQNNEIERSSTPEDIKRQKPSPQGNSSDWDFLLKSERHKHISEDLFGLLGVEKICDKNKNCTFNSEGKINTNSFLFSSFYLVLFSLHLLYEELKLNMLRVSELPFLAKFLHQIAVDLRMNKYVVHYWKDYPDICHLQINITNSQISTSDLNQINTLAIINNDPVNIMEHLYNTILGKEVFPFPFIKHINQQSKNFAQLCALIIAERDNNQNNIDVDSFITMICPPGARVESHDSFEIITNSYRKLTAAEKVVILMTKMGITRRDLDKLPPAINLLLHEALWLCRESPPTDWASESYYLIQRPDLAAQDQSVTMEKKNQRTRINRTQVHLQNVLPNMKQYDSEHEDGMEDVESMVLKLRFPEDRRVVEVRRLLQSSEPVHIGVVQRPEVSDHDFIEEQEKYLYAISTRTMALPVGRGMFTMRTTMPVVTEPLPVPRLCLSGRAPPRGAAVELSHIDTPPNMNLWPLFHNGVAAGLRISPDASDIDSTWIVFNKPKSTTETPMEHAGFLMALGLNGHLKNLARMNMYDYLIKFHEMTSVGLLLGLAASKRGTMDTVTTKTLSIHVEALLPPTSMELDVPQNVQVAALLGVGLVYQGSAHRHITEVLLSEIGRPPGPEMENSVDRESYSLAAGLALGLVTLKQGGQPSGFKDLGVPDMLHYYMVGGNKRPLTGSQKDKYKVPSFQIREGTSVNLDVTAPGATLALGLMYLGSGNNAIADWMKPPDTQYLLDFVRPDFLLLRILSRALILWDDIKTSIEWVENQIPEAIRPFCLEKPSNDIEIDIDYEAMNQAYCNIVAGACFAMGLRFAGSADENVFQTLFNYCRMFTSLTKKSIAELAGKPTIETCLNLILLSLAMVMAGTGRLEVLRLCRHLRKRVGVASSSVVTYGSHLATHMALGLLFLGGGRYTLSNSPASVAAMLCAFFPKFPTHSNDNRYHLQAFRHLYVLAVEPRLIIPFDILSVRMCYTNISIMYLNGTTVSMRGPCLLPDLNMLVKVSVQDERYWPVVFERGRNWEQLVKLLGSSGYVEVKQRAGCLSYLEDPMGSKSLLSRILTQTSIIPWAPLPSVISSFSSEPTVCYFTNYFLTAKPEDCSDEELRLHQMLNLAMYECVTKDKLAILPVWANLIKAIRNLKSNIHTYQVWQLKLVFAQVLNQKNNSIMSSEIALAMKQLVNRAMSGWESNMKEALECYISGDNISSGTDHINMANYITFHDIPFSLNNYKKNFLQMLIEMQNKNMCVSTVDKIVNMLPL